MTQEIRVALVGAGPAGQAHAFGYKNVSMASDLDARIVLGTVVDPNLDLANSVAARYGFEKVTADLQEVLDDSSIHAVSVALPNHLTAPTLKRLLKAGKHVLGEKPLGRSAAEAAELTALAASSGLTVGVGFSYRRIPALAAARQAVADGRIGTPYLARASLYADYALDPSTPLTWRFVQETSGGGALMDMGTHALDALEYFVGPIDEVSSALLNTVVTSRPMPGKPGQVGEVTNDDTAILTLRFSQGAVGTMVASRVTAGVPIDLQIEVYGSKGHVKFSFSRFNEFQLYEAGLGAPALDAPRTIIPGPDMPLFQNVMPMAFRGNPTGYGEAFIAEIQDFVRAIVTGEPMDTDFATATRTMDAAQAALDAAASGSAVPLTHKT